MLNNQFVFTPQIMSYGTARHVKLMMVLHTVNGQINSMPTEGVYQISAMDDIFHAEKKTET